MDRIARLLVPFLMGQRRDGLARVCTFDTHPWEVLDLPQFADVHISDANAKMARMGQIYGQLARRVRSLLADGRLPLSIAGDCVSTLGMLGGLQQAGRAPRRILWLDAHGDFHTWSTTQTQYLGGMPLALLVGKGDRRRNSRDAVSAMRTAIGVQPYPEGQVLLSDARDLDPGEREALEESAIVRCRIDEVLDRLDPAESLYVHFDTDVLDAEQQMPALKYHVKSGPSPAELAALFRALRGHAVVAVSVSAWHEEKDPDNAAAQVCLDLLEALLPGRMH